MTCVLCGRWYDTHRIAAHLTRAHGHADPAAFNRLAQAAGLLP